MLNSALIMSALEYPIYLNVGANGTASISKTKAKRGERIDINCSPIAAWRVASCISPQVVIQGSGNSRWFYMPDSVVDISVTFEEIPPEEGFFRVRFEIKKDWVPIGHGDEQETGEQDRWGQYEKGIFPNIGSGIWYYEEKSAYNEYGPEVYRGPTAYIEGIRIKGGQKNSTIMSWFIRNTGRTVSIWVKP